MENYRGLIFSKYKNITEFASAVGWTRNKASRIANGIQEPDAEDMEKMADALGINSPEQFMHVFFRQLSGSEERRIWKECRYRWYPYH